MAVGSAEDGFYAGGEFTRAERFYEIIVTADFEADHAVNFTGAGGEEDDRHGRARADGLAEFEAAAVGQADVEDDESEGLRSQCGEAGLARGAPVGFEALGLERVEQRVGDGGFVFDDEDFLGHAERLEGCA